ncbi:MAG: PLP-dependent aminotransferase family protein, partial [Burkholderia vietnamiensis]|nr:PLP-dependent aminotransferase family protein [Burkholderia vietnamiensis]
AAAREHGIGPFPLSGFSIATAPADNGLVLGFGNTSADAFAPMLRTLSTIAQRIAQAPRSEPVAYAEDERGAGAR